MTRLRITVMTFEPAPDADPFQVKGQFVSRDIATAEADLPEGQYVTRICVMQDGNPVPLSDTPFAIGMGHWIWVPPEIVEPTPDEAPALFCEQGHPVNDDGTHPRVADAAAHNFLT